MKKDNKNNICCFNLIFRGLTKEILLEEENKLKHIVTCNAEFIVKAQENDRFKTIINNNYATFDGQVPYFLAKLKYKNINFEKISGSDLIYDFASLAKKKNYKIFLLGGYKKSNELAVKKLKEMYNIDIDGYSPPYENYPFSRNNNELILKRIEIFKPDILFVAFGAIKQEYWIDDNRKFLEKIGVKWAVGCGGTFDFVAGTIKRAPKFVQNIGLEGVWRFIMEPKWFRLKRLLISLKIFSYL